MFLVPFIFILVTREKKLKNKQTEEEETSSDLLRNDEEGSIETVDSMIGLFFLSSLLSFIFKKFNVRFVLKTLKQTVDRERRQDTPKTLSSSWL